MVQQDKEIAKDGMVGAIPVNPEMATTLKIDSNAEDIQKLMDSAAEQFNFPQLKEKYKQTLRSSGKFTGSDKSEEAIELATQMHFDQFYVFQPPTQGFSTKLARTYVNRARIGKRYGWPVLAVGILASVVWAGSVATNAIRLRAAESSVENAVEESYRTKLSLGTQVSDLNSQKSSLPDSTELTELIRNSKDNLRGTDEFFEKYCDEGTADDDIDRSNYSEAQQKLDAINGVLATVKGKVNAGQGLIRTEQDLVSTRQGLDSLIQEIKSSNPPSVLRTRAQSAYDSGIASVTNRQLEEGRKYRQQLQGIKSDVKEFETLPGRLEQVYVAITEVAKIQAALDVANTLHSEGQTYVTTVNMPSLKEVITKLEATSARLNQEFEIRIVSRPGYKSGVDTYYDAPRGRHPDSLSESEKRRYFSGYHLFVEAYDSNNRKVSQTITSSETQQTREVTMWGEKIPGDYGNSPVWNRIVADKKQDGIVNENVFGRKRKGYLEQEVVLNGVSGRIGQIFYED